VDQLDELARGCGLPHRAFGENYNFGLPFCRVVGGNAVLSRTPLEPVGNPSLIGRKPFWETKNSRRALFVQTELRGQSVLLGSLHNDSYDRRTNAAQVRQLLDFIAARACWPATSTPSRRKSRCNC
jgi:endonuclease/exonuclease/phosphatase family metal-dependent hydrolase